MNYLPSWLVYVSGLRYYSVFDIIIHSVLLLNFFLIIYFGHDTWHSEPPDQGLNLGVLGSEGTEFNHWNAREFLGIIFNSFL